MSKPAAWVTLASVTAVVAAALLFIVFLRYPMLLVYPAPPVPNYQMQATIASVGILLAVIVATVTGCVARNHQERRTSLVVTGAASVLGIGVLAAILALTLPTL